LEFGAANAQSNNLSVLQTGGTTNLANSAVLEVDHGFQQTNVGGTLKTNDATTCTIRVGDVTINGGNVKLGINAAAGTFGKLTIEETLTFNGGEYDPRINGAASGQNDQLTADNLVINGGSLVVSVIGVKGAGTWNILVKTVRPIANKFPNERLNGTVSTLTNTTPGNYQLK
jgi:hypothetical protein